LEVDLVSYSSWDLCQDVKSAPKVTDSVRETIHNTLDFIAEHAPPKSDYAAQALDTDTPQIYIGEYGSPLNLNGIDASMQAIRTVDREARAWGVPYTLFWQAYDNEVLIDGEEVIVDPDIESILEKEFPNGVTRNDLRGYYLRYPDGTRAPPWYYFAEAFETNQSEFHRVDLEFDHAVSSAKIDPDIEQGEGRDLTFACSEVDVETTQSSTTLNIGTPGEEGALARGVFPPEETPDRTFRWFGRPTAHTRLYIHRTELGLSGAVKELRLRGHSADEDLTAKVSLDGKSIETLTLDTNRREYSVQVNGST
jgi:hypothetical protein